MSSFVEYTIVVLVIFFIIVLFVGMVASVFKIISFLTEGETNDMSDKEKLEKSKQKNIIWLGLGVLIGWGLFSG